jgi:hypothetical protein
MYELREYEDGSYSLRFDEDFMFNVFRNYIETKYPTYEVYLVHLDKEMKIAIGNVIGKDEVKIISEFMIKKMEKEIKKEIGYNFPFDKDTSITIDDYHDFMQVYLLTMFKNAEWDEEDVELEHGELEKQNVVHCKEIPDMIWEVMVNYYEH